MSQCIHGSHWYIVSIYSEGDREEKRWVAKIATMLHISGVRERGGSRGVRLDEPKLNTLQFVWEAKHVCHMRVSVVGNTFGCFGAESRAPDWRTTMFFVFVIPWRRARAWFGFSPLWHLANVALQSRIIISVGVKYLWRGDWKRQILGKSADITVKLEYLFIYFANPLRFRFWIWLESVTCWCSELNNRARSTSGPVWYYISVLCFVFED